MIPVLPLEVLASLRLVTWLSLLDTYGAPDFLPRADAARLSALDVATRISTEGARLPLPLARALVVIVFSATEEARRHVYNAADALAFPHRWPEATSPADLVAQLLAIAPRDPAVSLLLDAAGILRNRAFRPRARHRYLGLPSAAPPSPASALEYAVALGESVRALFAEWCVTRDFGQVLSVTAGAVDSASRIGPFLSWEILHEDRPATDLVVAPAPRGRRGAQPAVTPITRRALRSHHVTYVPSRRRLAITTDCPEAATPLARIFGLAIARDRRHFLELPAIDLWKLQELGVEALRIRELAGKLTMSAIGGTWHSGKGHAITPRGRDFFKALARYKIRIEGGRLDLVTLRGAILAAQAGAPRECDVVLRPPHLCTVSEPELEPLIDEFLDTAKLADPEPRERDFIAMQPWNDVAAGWIAAEGEAGFAALVAEGVLKANPENRAVTPPDHPFAGPTATAYPLRGTKYLAWSPDPTVAPFVVEEADLVSYTLQFGKLAAKIARALGLEGPAAKLDEDGVLACGRRALGPTHVLVFLPTRPIRATTAERLRDAAGHGHAVLVLPSRRLEAHGLRALAMPKLAGPWQPLLAEIVRVLRLEAIIPATVFAPEWARFVLQRATQRVWLDGVECRVTELHFRLLEFLIERDGTEVHTKDIADYVARGRGHEDTTRRQIESLARAIEKSFTAAKKRVPREVREMIRMTRLGYYALGVRGIVV